MIKRSIGLPIICTFVLSPGASLASGDVTFENIAPTAGVSFGHVPSSDQAVLQAIWEDSLVTPVSPMALPTFPHVTYGLAGVAVFDADGDGDLDLFAPNGAGGANSLYINQLEESGSTTFIDQSATAGVEALDMDGSGVCTGDIDNDGDTDLLVTGREADVRLFENQGDGTFVHRADSGLSETPYFHTSCAMGDVDGDGILDVVIANNFDSTANMLPIFVVPFDLNHPNELYLGNGDGTFLDVSDGSGIRNPAGVPPGAATITWATSMVDIDLDGDTDIVFADDQAAVPFAAAGGVDRGFVQVMLNDGSGNFTAQNAPGFGAWMGLSFGDLDCDADLDMWTTNFGDYTANSLGMPTPLGAFATRAHYGNGDGTFEDGGLPAGVASTSFGWGISMVDVDNDGDSDVIHHGGLEVGVMVGADNPGTVLLNEGCGASYTQVVDAFDVDHIRRNVRGVATGDFDRDGWVDVATSANLTNPAPIPLVPSPAQYGGPLDATAAFVPLLAPLPDGTLQWTGVQPAPGDLTVEINQGAGNRGVTIRPVGTVDITSGGAVNRGGIGAVMSFRPKHADDAAIMPILAGGSHGSASASEAYFGLGDARRGRLEVLWPGGVKNRLYGVRAGEVATMPEIPCSIDAPSFFPYLSCVHGALDELGDAGVINWGERVRLFVSAIVGFFDGS